MSSVFSRQRLADLKESPTRKRSHTILLVDDEPSNVRVLSAMLADQYEILTADDGVSALEVIERHSHPERIALVISDQRMPRMTGLQLFERLDSTLPSAKRIVVTGYMDVEVILSAINQARIHQFVLKPIDRNEMLLIVQRAVESFEMERQLESYVDDLEHKVAERTRELEQRNEELKVAYQQVEEASLTDPLTRLKNRRFIQQHFDAEVSLIDRHSDDGEGDAGDLLFLLVDIDHFKPVNDHHGHDCGDRLLEAFADRLREVFRDSDLLVRWGGEEFLVVARFARREGGAAIAERLRAAIAESPFEIGAQEPLGKTCSIGFAPYPTSASRPEAAGWTDVVNLADAALYAAKLSGRNRWVGIESVNGEPADASIRAILDDPAGALDQGWITVTCRGDDVSNVMWRQEAAGER